MAALHIRYQRMNGVAIGNVELPRVTPLAQLVGGLRQRVLRQIEREDLCAQARECDRGRAPRAAALLVDPIEKAVTDPEQVQALKYMVVITGSLDHLLGENLAAALGLSFGFSALDGD